MGWGHKIGGMIAAKQVRRNAGLRRVFEAGQVTMRAIHSSQIMLTALVSGAAYARRYLT